MDNIERELLISEKIRVVEIDGEEYFCIEDIKNRLPEYKVDTDHIREADFDGTIDVAVRRQDIYPMTDFDKNVARFAKFKGKA